MPARRGKIITDEVPLGILGENAFDGTPLNTKAPDRVSGCLVRFCGRGRRRAVRHRAGRWAPTPAGRARASQLLRPVWHPPIARPGGTSQACCRRRPTSETTGWFARNAATFARVSAVLLGDPIPSALPTRLIVAIDAFGFADPAVTAALRPIVDQLAALIGSVR
jgi:amidase